MVNKLLRLVETIRRQYASIKTRSRVNKYLTLGCRPWTLGYADYREIFIRDVLKDDELLNRFRHNQPLPDQYGFRLDERVIEYPWILSRLDIAESLLLDAGSALNFSYLLELPQLKSRSIVIYNLSPENVVKRHNVSYLYGDLRRTVLDSERFDEIVCISTLEHIGMDNTFLYSKDSSFNEFKPDDYQYVVKEFWRLLKPGGKLFVTVPYGRYENLGWLQQFDQQRVEKVVEVFGGSESSVTNYRYFGDSWQVADAEACDTCSYFDIHNRDDYEADYVAAARAVACIEMIK